MTAALPQALDFDCPDCPSKAGKRCRSHAGNTVRTHTRRTYLAQDAFLKLSLKGPQ